MLRWRSDHQEPTLDVGCGTLHPVRWSELCVVYQYDHVPRTDVQSVEDKPFEAFGLVVTTGGTWDFYGVDGHRMVDPQITVTGTLGRHYGCRHSTVRPDSNIIVALRPGALDGDEPTPFGSEIVSSSAEPRVRLALAQEDSDDFESCIFEVLDAFAIHSGGLGSRPHGYLRMQRVKRFIERHALEAIPLARIADIVNMSPFSLLRQFKAHMGMTPHDYIMSLRLDAALELLKQADLSIGDVGRKTGFADQRYFARWFLKSVGMSPTTYRSRLA